jgi:hypothetical protein
MNQARFKVLTEAKMPVFWAVIALMMEAASISESSVKFYENTRSNIPEDSHLYLVKKLENFFEPGIDNVVGGSSSSLCL